MATFLYRCPTTGRNVQGWLAEEVNSDNGDNVYEAVPCLAAIATVDQSLDWQGVGRRVRLASQRRCAPIWKEQRPQESLTGKQWR